MRKPYRITDHAREEMERRGIPEEVVAQIMTNPGQIVSIQDKRKAYQSKIGFTGKLYVVRIVVEENDPLVIVTVYRTSKIDKYWSKANESNL
jgi:hypothetical protein